jgi:hypothetical protein
VCVCVCVCVCVWVLIRFQRFIFLASECLNPSGDQSRYLLTYLLRSNFIKVDFNEGAWFHKGHEFHHHKILIGGGLKKQPMGSIGV